MSSQPTITLELTEETVVDAFAVATIVGIFWRLVIHSTLLNAITFVSRLQAIHRAIRSVFVLELRAYFNRTCAIKRKEHAD